MEKNQHDINRDEAIRTVRAKLAFYYHAFIFAVICLIMLGINLMYSPQIIWFFWPLLAWSILLASHGFQVFAVREGSTIRRKMIEKEMKKRRPKA